VSILAVFYPRRFARLLASDAMSICRDPMLAFAIVLSTTPALAMLRWSGIMDAAVSQRFGIAEFSRYVAPVALLVPASLIGWVTGFLLLEDRDDGPLLALDVTPVGKVGFLCYRVAVTTLVVAALTLMATTVVTPTLGWPARTVVALLVAAAAVLSAIVLPALARNKVEGLALTKLTNFACVVPLVAIVPSPWRYAAGVIPTFWLGELLGLSRIPHLSPPWVALAASVSHGLVALWLLTVLRRRVG
jgi:fluoroquinolone transport system permease protein